MEYAILALGLLVTPATAETFVTHSRQFMMCSSVEHMLENCNLSRVNQTVCNWIDPPGHAKGYSQMIAQGWLSQKKFEDTCKQVCDGKITPEKALRKFCPNNPPKL